MKTILIDNYYYLVNNSFFPIDKNSRNINFCFDNSLFINKIDIETNNTFLGSEDLIKEYLEGAKIVTYDGTNIYYKNKVMEYDDFLDTYTVLYNGNYSPIDHYSFPSPFLERTENLLLKRPFGIKYSDEAFLFQTFFKYSIGYFITTNYINLEKLPNLKKHHWTAESKSLTFADAIPGKPQIVFLRNDKLWQLKFPLGITPKDINYADSNYLKKRLKGLNAYGDLRYITEPLLFFKKNNKNYLFIPQPFENYALDGQIFAKFEYVIYEFGRYCCLEHCFNKNKN